MSAVAAIHVAKKQLGLDEDTYRALLVRETGKNSTAKMTEQERRRVIEVLRNQGFKPASMGSQKGLQGRYAKKLQALWIAGWNLGIVRDRKDAALLAFVRRQTGLDHVRFLHDPEDARRAIEGLKAWMAREGGVDWTIERHLPAWMQEDGFRVASAQFRKLRTKTQLFHDHANLRDWLRAETGQDLVSMTAPDWIAVMNTLGEIVRKVSK